MVTKYIFDTSYLFCKKMSISDLLVPNTYKLYVNNVSGPIATDSITNVTSAGTVINNVKINSGMITLNTIPTLDDTQTEILARNNSTGVIVYRDNIVDTSSVQTLTNKSIDSASSTINVNGTNINSLINQDVRTTSSPQFTSETLNKTTNPQLSFVSGSYTTNIAIDTLGAHYFLDSNAGDLCIQNVNSGDIQIGPGTATNAALTVETNGIITTNINSNSFLNLQGNQNGPVTIGAGSSLNNALYIGGQGAAGTQPSFIRSSINGAYLTDTATGDLIFYLTTANAFRFGFTNSANSQMYVNASGVFTNSNITLNSGNLALTSGNIILPTTGGTAANLNFYEEYTDSSFGFAGPWTARNTTLYITRIGKICILQLASLTFTASTATYIASTGTIPSRFNPIAEVEPFVEVYNNSSFALGSATLQTSGGIQIYNGPSGSNFASTGIAGFLGVTICYRVA